MAMFPQNIAIFCHLGVGFERAALVSVESTTGGCTGRIAPRHGFPHHTLSSTAVVARIGRLTRVNFDGGGHPDQSARPVNSDGGAHPGQPRRRLRRWAPTKVRAAAEAGAGVVRFTQADKRRQRPPRKRCRLLSLRKC